jgi:hypothetical protein
VSHPDWATFKAGSRTRVALWLASEVGEGGTFTKAQLREAFPLVEQIDRRMRDLRAEGWIIATYREDRSLASDELRLVTVGGHVWDKGYHSRTNALSERDRRSTLAADDYVCRFCGIGPGEPYPDDRLQTAKLSVATLRGGTEPQRLTLCDRCMPSAERPENPNDVVMAIQGLDSEALDTFRSWVRSRERPRTTLEQLWARFRRLPAGAREEVESYLQRGRTE